MNCPDFQDVSEGAGAVGRDSSAAAKEPFLARATRGWLVSGSTGEPYARGSS